MPIHIIKVYTDKQHTRSIWCLQLIRSETSTHTVRPRLVQQQHERACESSCHTLSNFSTCWELGWSPLAALLPPSPFHAICCYGPASKLSTCYLHTGTHPRLTRGHRGRVPGLSVCVLMSSIRISLVVVLVYRRRSLSYDIIAMCGWRLISGYRLIEIIPSIFKPEVLLFFVTHWLRYHQDGTVASPLRYRQVLMVP